MRHSLFLFLLAALVFGAGCAAIMGGGGTKKKSAKATHTAEDQDQGVDRLNGLLKEFRSSLEEKQFEQAGSWLRQAEKGVKEASEVTKGHPDFEEVVERVTAARP